MILICMESKWSQSCGINSFYEWFSFLYTWIGLVPISAVPWSLKLLKLRKYTHVVTRKRKRSDSVLWQKPLHQQKCPKGILTTQTTQQKSSIKERLRTDLGISNFLVLWHHPYIIIFPWSICNGCDIPIGDAHSSAHTVPSNFGLAYVLLVETNPLPERVVIFSGLFTSNIPRYFLYFASNLLQYFICFKITDEGPIPWCVYGPYCQIKNDLSI